MLRIRTRSRISTISSRFLGFILRVLRLEASVNNVYIKNQFQTTFGGVGGGGGEVGANRISQHINHQCYKSMVMARAVRAWWCGPAPCPGSTGTRSRTACTCGRSSCSSPAHRTPPEKRSSIINLFFYFNFYKKKVLSICMLCWKGNEWVQLRGNSYSFVSNGFSSVYKINNYSVLRIWIQNPVFYAPRSGMEKKSGLGSGMNIPNLIFGELSISFWVKIDPDPDPGSCQP